MLKNVFVDPASYEAVQSEHMHTRRLRVADVPALAALERAIYPPEMQAGEEQLEIDLTAAQLDDSNFGFGLFDGEELVGVLLVYYEPDCREIFPFFDLECPPDMVSAECLYVADLSVRREYARYTQRLLKGCWQSIAPELRKLPVYAFSLGAAVERWRRRPRAFNWVGYDYVSDRCFKRETDPHEIFLVRFEATARPKHRAVIKRSFRIEEIRTDGGWAALEPQWDELLRQTPDATGFQTFRVQRAWARVYMQNSRPFILAVYRGRELCAIAPLRIENVKYWGQQRRLLKFIGEPSEMDRPTILRKGDDPQIVRAIFEHVLAREALWDCLLLYEQPRTGVVLVAADEVLHRPDLLLATVEGPPCPWVDLRGSWAEFIASKPRSFRKQITTKLNRMAREGKVRFASYETWPEVKTGFDLYVDVERRSWKPRERLGVTKDAKSLRYHASLVDELGPLGQLRFRVLFLDDRAIAASFGVLIDGRFLSLHIAHDLDYGRFSPGVLLTANELEACYAAEDCSYYEFLGGFLNNKMTWTANVRETRQLFAYRRTLFFKVHYAWHFEIQPPLKALLRRAKVLDPLLKIKAAWHKLRGIES
jgi:CelD/BcsL family acetyltransferase involved in cellulose biosynthesis